MVESHGARLLELVEELGGDRVRDLFRELLQGSLQELIDGEVTARIGVEPDARTDTRIERRNGARFRLVSIPTGDVELRIPQVRVGSFFPSLLAPRRRVDRAVIMTASVIGISTRQDDEVPGASDAQAAGPVPRGHAEMVAATIRAVPRRDPPRRSRPLRPTRGMASHRPPLPLRRLSEPQQLTPTTRRLTTRRDR